jgi:CheY-like chemotaxis protein
MTPDTTILLDAIAANNPPAPTRLLIVDDNVMILDAIGVILEGHGYEVVTACDVREALRHISSETFDVLVSDLHMPGAGDGLTVVSAMRHFHPKAVTILLSAFPEMEEATKAILKQTDEVLVKPMKIADLVSSIADRLARGAAPARVIESVAAILERETTATIEEWLECVDVDPLITIVALDDNRRCAHLPQLFLDLVQRLRHPLPLGKRALISSAATEHGVLRYRQGYTAAMMVEESRMLQVSIFQTLQNNLHQVDFSVLLVGVMAIADEVDSQLAQAMMAFVVESKSAGLGLTA